MARVRYFSALLLAIASFDAVLAAPAADTVYPEVIPGEGLPSLAELNITSAELYTMPIDSGPVELVTRATQFDPRCGPSDAAYTNVNGIIACYNYLKGLGEKQCKAGSNKPTEMCRSGNGHVSGQAVGKDSTSSYCADVSLAVLWVINSCTRRDQSVAGFQAANGNGNLVVGGTNIRW